MAARSILHVFTDGAFSNNIGGCGIYFCDAITTPIVPCGIISSDDVLSFIMSRDYANVPSHPLCMKLTGTASAPITSQRCELIAIYIALQNIMPHIDKYESVIIYTDSSYALHSLTEWYKNWINRNWRTESGYPVKNIDLIKPIIDILTTHKKIDFRYVESHTGKTDFVSFGNNIADLLAVAAKKS